LSSSHEQTGFGKSKCKADIALLNPEANPEVMSSLVRLAPDYLLNRYLGRTTESLVYHAVQYQKDELFSILLDHNADIEAGDYHHDWRPIHMACYRGSITMVQALIDKGADIHCSTTGGQGPCIHRMGICRAKPWAGMPLHIAATSGQLEIVRTLIYHGADVNARAKSEEETSGFSTRGHGPTALDLALVTAKFDDRLDEILSKDRLRVAQLLLDSGAMVSGVVSRMSPEERARFDEFPGLWEALLAGEKALKEKENWK
jgi:ankyrin repeat protein